MGWYFRIALLEIAIARAEGLKELRGGVVRIIMDELARWRETVIWTAWRTLRSNAWQAWRLRSPEQTTQSSELQVGSGTGENKAGCPAKRPADPLPWGFSCSFAL